MRCTPGSVSMSCWWEPGGGRNKQFLLQCAYTKTIYLWQATLSSQLFSGCTGLTTQPSVHLITDYSKISKQMTTVNNDNLSTHLWPQKYYCYFQQHQAQWKRKYNNAFGFQAAQPPLTARGILRHEYHQPDFVHTPSGNLSYPSRTVFCITWECARTLLNGMWNDAFPRGCRLYPLQRDQLSFAKLRSITHSWVLIRKLTHVVKKSNYNTDPGRAILEASIKKLQPEEVCTRMCEIGRAVPWKPAWSGTSFLPCCPWVI